MQRLDWLRISLLAGVTGCGTSLDDGEADGHTTTSMGASSAAEGSGTGTGDDASTDEESTGDESTGDAETDDEGEMCESGCEDPVQLAEGIVQCADGRLNRVGGGTFDPTITAPACAGNETYLECTSDEDCGGSPYGKCIHGDVDGLTLCGCARSCSSDDDCDEGRVCLPPNILADTPDWPTCRTPACESGSDCGECGECGLGAVSDDCGTYHAIQCRTGADSCTADADCAPDGACFPDMFIGVWVCQSYVGSGCIGRPLMVDAVARTTSQRQRADWAASPRGIEMLREDTELAAYWAEIAALEHASVASFARFGAQLLALGAPPELLRACKRAALDEIEHARLAYGLASAYAGRAIGPGQLELNGVSTTACWREVVAGLIQEACVGETLGVAEAMAAAEVARVPVVRRVLERIVADELRHARLAWRSLAWVLREADDTDRAWAQALLERTIRIASQACDASSRPHRPADGVLGGSSRARVLRAASSQVLAPLARMVVRRSAVVVNS
jgi:hypothetical protein